MQINIMPSIYTRASQSPFRAQKKEFSALSPKVCTESKVYKGCLGVDLVEIREEASSPVEWQGLKKRRLIRNIVV